MMERLEIYGKNKLPINLIVFAVVENPILNERYDTFKWHISYAKWGTDLG